MLVTTPIVSMRMATHITRTAKMPNPKPREEKTRKRKRTKQKDRQGLS